MNYYEDKKVISMLDMEYKLFIIEFNKASQLDRSFSKSGINKSEILKFRKYLVKYCIELMDRIDDCTITTKMIRDKIRKLKELNSNISYGQAQKVINVCLKQYLFLTKNIECINQLDCPLDTITMKGYGIKNNRMINVTEEDYIKYQNIFEEKYIYRILKDLKYDKERINNFFK